MNKFLRNVGFYLLIILVAISIIDYFSTRNTTKQEVGYTQFLQQVDEGKVTKVVLIQNTIRGTLSDGNTFLPYELAAKTETEKVESVTEKVSEEQTALTESDEEVDAAIDALTSMMEPLIMVVLGGAVGFLMIAMYMPMFSMSDAIKG